MRLFHTSVLVLAVLFLSACATTPQSSMELSKDALGADKGRLGLAMVALPKVDTEFPGAGCLLCYAFASGANSTLTAHTHSLPSGELLSLKADLARLIQAKGGTVVVIDDDLKLDALPNSSAKGPNIAKKDFSSLKTKYNVDRLLVIEIDALGIWRTYSAYVPTGDPKAIFKGMGYIVNLSNNTFEWYMPLDITKSAEGSWDEPPKYPGLTNAYFQALELAKDQFTGPFKAQQSLPLAAGQTQP